METQASGKSGDPDSSMNVEPPDRLVDSITNETESDKLVEAPDSPKDNATKGAVATTGQRKSRSACRAPSRDPQKCQSTIREMIGKHETRNSELEQLEGDLRERLDMLECSMPAVMVWNILRMTEGAPPSVVRRLMEKQFEGVNAAGNSAVPSTPSQHYDCRVREIEAERKKALGRAEEARVLLMDREATIRDRRERLEEAKKCNRERKERIEMLNRQAAELREATKNARGDEGSSEAGEIRRKEKLLDRVGSLSSIGSTDLENFAKLQELAESEVCMKRRINELERREEAYMKTLQQADELWSKMEVNDSSNARDLQEQLDLKTAANQRLADRICQLEDEVEKLKKRLLTCNEKLGKFTDRPLTDTDVGFNDGVASVEDRGTIAKPETNTLSSSASPETVNADIAVHPQTEDKDSSFMPETTNKGVEAQTKMLDKEAEAIVESREREVDTPTDLGVEIGVGDAELPASNNAEKKSDDLERPAFQSPIEPEPKDDEDIPEAWKNWNWDDGCPPGENCVDFADDLRSPRNVPTIDSDVQATVTTAEKPAGYNGTVAEDSSLLPGTTGKIGKTELDGREIALSREELRNWYNVVNSVHHTISQCDNCQSQVDATTRLMAKMRNHLRMMALPDEDESAIDRKTLTNDPITPIENAKKRDPDHGENKIIPSDAETKVPELTKNFGENIQEVVDTSRAEGPSIPEVAQNISNPGPTFLPTDKTVTAKPATALDELPERVKPREISLKEEKRETMKNADDGLLETLPEERLPQRSTNNNVDVSDIIEPEPELLSKIARNTKDARANTNVSAAPENPERRSETAVLPKLLFPDKTEEDVQPFVRETVSPSIEELRTSPQKRESDKSLVTVDTSKPLLQYEADPTKDVRDISEDKPETARSESLANKREESFHGKTLEPNENETMTDSLIEPAKSPVFEAQPQVEERRSFVEASDEILQEKQQPEVPSSLEISEPLTDSITREVEDGEPLHESPREPQENETMADSSIEPAMSSASIDGQPEVQERRSSIDASAEPELPRSGDVVSPLVSSTEIPIVPEPQQSSSIEGVTRGASDQSLEEIVQAEPLSSLEKLETLTDPMTKELEAEEASLPIVEDLEEPAGTAPSLSKDEEPAESKIEHEVTETTAPDEVVLEVSAEKVAETIPSEEKSIRPEEQEQAETSPPSTSKVETKEELRPAESEDTCTPRTCTPVTTQTSPQIPRTLDRIRLKMLAESSYRSPDVLMWRHLAIGPKRRRDQFVPTSACVDTQTDGALGRGRITHRGIERQDDRSGFGVDPRKTEFGRSYEAPSSRRTDERLHPPTSRNVAELFRSTRLPPTMVSPQTEIPITQNEIEFLAMDIGELSCAECRRPMTSDGKVISSKIDLRGSSKPQKRPPGTLRQTATASTIRGAGTSDRSRCCECDSFDKSKIENILRAKREPGKRSGEENTSNENPCCPCPIRAEEKRAGASSKSSRRRNKPEKKDQSVTAHIPRKNLKKVHKGNRTFDANDEADITKESSIEFDLSLSDLSKIVTSSPKPERRHFADCSVECFDERASVGKSRSKVDKSIKRSIDKISASNESSQCICGQDSLPRSHHKSTLQSKITENDSVCDCGIPEKTKKETFTCECSSIESVSPKNRKL